MTYETIIGLEIHLQLKTKSKMFCGCSNDAEEQAPNSLVCPICLGHPGILPTINEEAVHQGMAIAMALNCRINLHSKFDRKNYFYPDLPKGYQISQFDEPLAEDGYLMLQTNHHKVKIGIERLHLEEDAAKNVHRDGRTLVDFNRGGTPLAEIVTRPDFHSAQEAKDFLQELRLIARYLGVSDADMEKGHLRCDANISLRPSGDNRFYPKTEIKNLNSFRSVFKALEYEAQRQQILWESSNPPQLTETRGCDDDKEVTREHRTKEGSSDYRYFPEPDLPPLDISPETIKEVKNSLPELPTARRARLAEEYGLSIDDVNVLVNNKYWAEYYEEVMSELRAWLFKADGAKLGTKAAQAWQENKIKISKLAYGWLTSELFKLLPGDFKFSDLKISAENMAEFLSLIYNKQVNSSAAQKLLMQMFITGDDPSYLMEKLDLGQIEDAATLEDLVIKVIMMHPEQVAEYKNGKSALLKFFVGKVMGESGGKANPEKVEEILKKKLK